MEWVLKLGGLIFLAGLVWSLVVTFRISKGAGVMNLLLWPIPYLYCAFKDFSRVRYSLLVLLLGAALMGIAFWSDPFLRQVFQQALEAAG